MLRRRDLVNCEEEIATLTLLVRNDDIPCFLDLFTSILDSHQRT